MAMCIWPTAGGVVVSSSDAGVSGQLTFSQHYQCIDIMGSVINSPFVVSGVGDVVVVQG